MNSQVLVLDANILIRAVLGNKVRDYIINYNDEVDFFTPEICIEDAEKYLPQLFVNKRISPSPALEVLKHIQGMLKVVTSDIYRDYKEDAIRRIQARDINDWPIVATALTFNSAIWTEDQDFFGSGISTWTTRNIHIFFGN
ncbi:MAG: nucleotide-binding protein [Legionella longbeachae]|nr:nucleotide-binding protein [Legionella longbeachae]